MAPEKIIKVINELMKRNIKVDWLSITTNGSVFDEYIIYALNLMNEYAEFGVTLRISADPHHVINKDKLNANIEKFRQSFKGKLEVQVDVPFILPGYSHKTNFNCTKFLIDINQNLIIAAKLIRYDGGSFVYDKR